MEDKKKSADFVGVSKTALEEPIFYLSDSTANAHTMVIGATGKGKSSTLEREAIRLGITYAELLERIEPTEEQKAAISAMEQKRAEARKVKETTIRNAVWSTFDEDDISELYYALKSVLEIAEPTKKQAKHLFFLLSMSIVGNIVAWGISDTPTRESIWEFTRENKTLLLDLLASESSDSTHR